MTLYEVKMLSDCVGISIILMVYAHVKQLYCEHVSGITTICTVLYITVFALYICLCVVCACVLIMCLCVSMWVHDHVHACDVHMFFSTGYVV